VSSVEALAGLMDRSRGKPSARVATKNAPHRYGDANNARDFQRLADEEHVTVIGGEEIPDAAAKRLTPRGWRRHRPTKAKSEALYWDPVEWKCLGRGAFKISSDKAPAPRFILWALLEHRETGVIRRIGVAHLIAFKTRNKAHGAEYTYQAAKVAEWLSRGPRRVVLCDANGSPDGHWLAEVMKVANAQTPPTKSGPHDDFIDLILTAKGIDHAVNAVALKGYHGDHKPVVADLPLTKEHR
jgi:hypothetical protein